MKLKLISINSWLNWFKIINLYFTHKKQSTSNIMFWVIIATIPGIICQIYFFSSGIIYQILFAIVTAFICELIALKLRKLQALTYLKDNSALVTALLLAISIPPLSPWWLIVLGTIFSILIAKHVYGGLGQNPFNPAMIGYVILLISFPIQMTSWLPPVKLQSIYINTISNLQLILFGHTSTGITLNKLILGFDGLTQATPLDSFKTNLLTHSFNEILNQPIFGNILAGIGWEWINIAYLFGGIILFYRKVITWQIPLAYLIVLILCSSISWLIMPLQYLSPIIHLFSGATMFGAFFIATDPVTAPTTPYGRVIYGAIIGLLIWIIRVYGGYPDAIAFAVLLANTTTPLLDYYTQPRVYGHV